MYSIFTILTGDIPLMSLLLPIIKQLFFKVLFLDLNDNKQGFAGADPQQLQKCVTGLTSQLCLIYKWKSNISHVKNRGTKGGKILMVSGA